MLFTTKLASTLFAITASALSVQSAVVARHELAQVSVVFFDDVNFVGAAYSPNGLVQGLCTTLPGDWLDRAESVLIASGYACTFFGFQGCAGPGIALSGTVLSLPTGLYNDVESFFCSKSIA